eukprot:scaffold88061_cov60-Phaeocystis_antarctica.AAC.5
MAKLVRGEEGFGAARDFERSLASSDGDFQELRVGELGETRRQPRRGGRHERRYLLRGRRLAGRPTRERLVVADVAAAISEVLQARGDKVITSRTWQNLS